MRHLMSHHGRLSLIFITLLYIQNIFASDLLGPVYLTFEKEDTARSVTINFMTSGHTQTAFAYVGPDSSPGDQPRNYALKVRSRTEFIKGVDKTYHHALIDNLEPNTTYYFRVGDEKMGYSKEFKLRTLPAGREEIRLMVGGDMSGNTTIIDTAQAARKAEPHVILVGGDIAYANGKVENEDKWMKWFKKMESIMITPQGYLVPLILAIGNHETSIGSVVPGNKVPFFFKLFPQAGDRPYFKRRLGLNSGLIVLDSGHHTLHRKQVDFLKEALESYKDLPHRFAAYHAPLYPNHRSYSGTWARRGRKYWGKLFDKYHLTVGFEHHDHTLKRTYIIRDKKIAEKGTVYVGDGCWGKGARDHNEKWYLKKSTGDTHVWMTTISSDSVELKAVGKDEGVFDHFLLKNLPQVTQITELL